MRLAWCAARLWALSSRRYLLEQGGDEHAWRTPIATWGILAAFAAVIWCLVMRPWEAPDDLLPQEQISSQVVVDWSPWKDRRAWIAAFIFAAQGMAYYLLIAWLPAVYAEDGGNAAVTAALSGVFNACDPAGHPALSHLV